MYVCVFTHTQLIIIGMCGNANGDKDDDFVPVGSKSVDGFSSTDAVLDTWKTSTYLSL